MEKRTVEITLEKAKEWYKAGGDMREIALQAFKEEELVNKFPKTWEEFISTKYLDCHPISPLSQTFYGCFKDEEEADAYIAFGKLIQLRDEYWRIDGDWKPTYLNNVIRLSKIDEYYCEKYYIIHPFDTNGTICWILTFRTEEIRDEFYNNFKDLIEKAKMFL